MFWHHKINSRLKYWDTVFSGNRIVPDPTVRSDRVPTLRIRQYSKEKKVHYGIICETKSKPLKRFRQNSGYVQIDWLLTKNLFERFRELSTKPKKSLELVSNLGTFFWDS
jgi:hypothetical protein